MRLLDRGDDAILAHINKCESSFKAFARFDSYTFRDEIVHGETGFASFRVGESWATRGEAAVQRIDARSTTGPADLHSRTDESAPASLRSNAA